ncbi:unnamed protein product [Pedinophyceae sp. YPF-701]|nr:unnamed protein product [Pedinophyceae sp. YPF-701]
MSGDAQGPPAAQESSWSAVRGSKMSVSMQDRMLRYFFPVRGSRPGFFSPVKFKFAKNGLPTPVPPEQSDPHPALEGPPPGKRGNALPPLARAASGEPDGPAAERTLSPSRTAAVQMTTRVGLGGWLHVELKAVRPEDLIRQQRTGIRFADNEDESGDEEDIFASAGAKHRQRVAAMPDTIGRRDFIPEVSLPSLPFARLMGREDSHGRIRPDDALPSYGHIDVVPSWDYDSPALEDKHGAFHRLRLAMLYSGQGGGPTTSELVKENTEELFAEMSSGSLYAQASVAALPSSAFSPDSEAFKRWNSIRVDDLVNVRELAEFAANAHPRTLHDCKPMLALTQGLLRMLLDNRIKTYEEENVRLSQEVDEWKERAHKLGDKLKRNLKKMESRIRHEWQSGEEDDEGDEDAADEDEEAAEAEAPPPLAGAMDMVGSEGGSFRQPRSRRVSGARGIDVVHRQRRMSRHAGFDAADVLEDMEKALEDLTRFEQAEQKSNKSGRERADLEAWKEKLDTKELQKRIATMQGMLREEKRRADELAKAREVLEAQVAVAEKLKGLREEELAEAQRSNNVLTGRVEQLEDQVARLRKLADQDDVSVAFALKKIGEKELSDWIVEFHPASVDFDYSELTQGQLRNLLVALPPRLGARVLGQADPAVMARVLLGLDRASFEDLVSNMSGESLATAFLTTDQQIYTLMDRKLASSASSGGEGGNVSGNVAALSQATKLVADVAGGVNLKAALKWLENKKAYDSEVNRAAVFALAAMKTQHTVACQNAIKNCEPLTAAHILEAVPAQTRGLILARLPIDRAAAVLGAMDPTLAGHTIAELPEASVGGVLKALIAQQEAHMAAVEAAKAAPPPAEGEEAAPAPDVGPALNLTRVFRALSEYHYARKGLFTGLHQRRLDELAGLFEGDQLRNQPKVRYLRSTVSSDAFLETVLRHETDAALKFQGALARMNPVQITSWILQNGAVPAMYAFRSVQGSAFSTALASMPVDMAAAVIRVARVRDAANMLLGMGHERGAALLATCSEGHIAAVITEMPLQVSASIREVLYVAHRHVDVNAVEEHQLHYQDAKRCLKDAEHIPETNQKRSRWVQGILAAGRQNDPMFEEYWMSPKERRKEAQTSGPRQSIIQQIAAAAGRTPSSQSMPPAPGALGRTATINNILRQGSVSVNQCLDSPDLAVRELIKIGNMGSALKLASELDEVHHAEVVQLGRSGSVVRGAGSMGADAMEDALVGEDTQTAEEKLDSLCNEAVRHLASMEPPVVADVLMRSRADLALTCLHRLPTPVVTGVYAHVGAINEHVQAYWNSMAPEAPYWRVSEVIGEVQETLFAAECRKHLEFIAEALRRVYNVRTTVVQVVRNNATSFHTKNTVPTPRSIREVTALMHVHGIGSLNPCDVVPVSADLDVVYSSELDWPLAPNIAMEKDDLLAEGGDSGHPPAPVESTGRRRRESQGAPVERTARPSLPLGQIATAQGSDGSQSLKLPERVVTRLVDNTTVMGALERTNGCMALFKKCARSFNVEVVDSMIGVPILHPRRHKDEKDYVLGMVAMSGWAPGKDCELCGMTPLDPTVGIGVCMHRNPAVIRLAQQLADQMGDWIYKQTAELDFIKETEAEFESSPTGKLSVPEDLKGLRHRCYALGRLIGDVEQKLEEMLRLLVEIKTYREPTMNVVKVMAALHVMVNPSDLKKVVAFDLTNADTADKEGAWSFLKSNLTFDPAEESNLLTSMAGISMGLKTEMRSTHKAQLVEACFRLIDGVEHRDAQRASPALAFIRKWVLYLYNGFHVASKLEQARREAEISAGTRTAKDMLKLKSKPKVPNVADGLGAIAEV